MTLPHFQTRRKLKMTTKMERKKRKLIVCLKLINFISFNLSLPRCIVFWIHLSVNVVLYLFISIHINNKEAPQYKQLANSWICMSHTHTGTWYRIVIGWQRFNKHITKYPDARPCARQSDLSKHAVGGTCDSFIHS